MPRAGRRRVPSRLAVALAAVPLVAAGLAEAVVYAHHATPGVRAHPPTRPRRPVAAGERVAAGARAASIRALLARRSDAVLHHDRREWMATLDPLSPRFRQAQRREFDDLAAVPFASWSYTFAATGAQPAALRRRHYAAPVWSPTQFSLRYRLRGFDRAPTDLAQYPTFVRRRGGWYLASLSDYARAGYVSSLDLWDFGPVRVVHAPGVMVLGHPQALATMHAVAAETSRDIPRVTRVWGPRWPRRVVVLVPGSERELGLVVGDSGDLNQIAALATAEVRAGPGRPKPVGNRVGINPRNWPRLSPLGRQIVMTHELTHVATRGVTSAATPKWLAEGFADYVGYLDTGIPTTFVAQDLVAQLHRHGVPSRLPPDAQFDGGNRSLSVAYEGAWLACRLVAAQWGQSALVQLYAEVGRSAAPPPVAVAAALRRVLHTTPRRFLRQWQRYLHDELG